MRDASQNVYTICNMSITMTDRTWQRHESKRQ